mmetsp:Transcript_5481/g.12934  ORF Transcript_5481/g.12934 Transcript_5481/m.12934 type:complete len:379 (+) Transcript_5481:1025-2161(+)
MVQLQNGGADGLRVGGRHQETLHAVVQGLRDGIDAAAHHRLLKGHGLANDQWQDFVEGRHHHHVRRHVESHHFGLYVHHGDLRRRALALLPSFAAHVVLCGDLEDLIDILDLMVTNVPSADDELLQIGALVLMDQLRAGCGRVHLALPAAHRAQVQHQEVLVRVAQRGAHLAAVLGLLEVVQVLQRDAVVDGETCFRLEHAVVLTALHIRGEDNGARSRKGFSDHHGVDVFAHEDLLGVVIQLVLGPALMDNPHGGQLQLRGHQDDVAAHDGVGQQQPHPAGQQRFAQIRQKGRRGCVHDGHFQAQLLEVVFHGPRLGGEDGQGLTTLQDPRDIEAEVVGPISLQGVGEDGAGRPPRILPAQILRGGGQVCCAEAVVV